MTKRNKAIEPAKMITETEQSAAPRLDVFKWMPLNGSSSSSASHTHRLKEVLPRRWWMWEPSPVFEASATFYTYKNLKAMCAFLRCVCCIRKDTEAESSEGCKHVRYRNLITSITWFFGVGVWGMCCVSSVNWKSLETVSNTYLHPQVRVNSRRYQHLGSAPSTNIIERISDCIRSPVANLSNLVTLGW